MIQKPSQSRRMLTWVIGILMLASCAASFAGTFTVHITPKNSGQVLWSTLYPTGSGTITGSGGSFTYTMNQTYITLTFAPNPGNSIVKVMTNEGDDTTWVLAHGNQDSWYGPGENSKSVTVTFSGGTTPPPADPTGAFGFSFPTNNASLTAIDDVSGTYTGVTPCVHHRSYNVSVAQDELGKLSIMSGTVSGIVATGVSPSKAAVSGPIAIGALTTVNNKPTAALKGKFDGTYDGKATTASGAGVGPLELSTVGGTNGVSATASGSAKSDGVPYSVKNLPVQVPVTQNAIHNVHKGWSIALTITNTAPAGAKSSIMTSATLILPNGDHVSFPAKKTKYSAAGYKLSFKSGMNTTIQPNAVDKKSKVSITGMTLTKTGSVWHPTAGTISYQFLGQKGTADLMAFVTS